MSLNSLLVYVPFTFQTTYTMSKLVFKVPHKIEKEGGNIGSIMTQKNTATKQELASRLPADGSESTKSRESRAPVKPKSSFSMFLRTIEKNLLEMD